MISAGAEWRALLPFFPEAEEQSTPYGNTFNASLAGKRVQFLHGGWGKVAAAGSTQYAINRWGPERLINLGTCGGFAGRVKRGDVILAEKTVIYDIVEQMTDPQQAIERYSVEMDLTWLPSPPPQAVQIKTLVSADRDIIVEDIPMLIEQYQAVAADWESGAIAWTARRNSLPCLVLRGVSDLVDADVSEAYGNYAFFEEQCKEIMASFARNLPAWIEAFRGAE
ncbi:5'-methylthioadenosine/S-adenosylhomocysteine nucleosidase [bacterium]|nr:5'-methylthioadenosine/S-adenosylhomocysteine nucleosidase [bacterium]